jgi:RNA polymerase sigma factor (sigma-70 family)
VPKHDPLADPERMIKRVYAYVAYRLGDGADAEDVTSEVIERAIRYRTSFDAARGKPISWLIGIARTCVDDFLRRRAHHVDQAEETIAPGELEADTVRRLAVAAAVARLDSRDRDLIALRYGADLSAGQIAQLLGLKTNTVEVAIHRSRNRLRDELQSIGYGYRSAGVAQPATGRSA